MIPMIYNHHELSIQWLFVYLWTKLYQMTIMIGSTKNQCKQWLPI